MKNYNTTNKSLIIIMVALKHEAHALIQAYDLILRQHQPYKVYQKNNMILVISGVGFENMTSACHFIAKQQSQPIRWINFGIAGHSDHPVGQLCKITKVYQPKHSLCWQWTTNQDQEILYSQNKIETDYIKTGSYDMEAASFVATTLDYSPLEKINIYKIISDNPQQHHKQINAKKIKQLITNQLNALRILINYDGNQQ